MKKSISIIFTILFIFISSKSYSGPFGTEIYDNKDEFSDLKIVKSYNKDVKIYSTKNVPSDDSAFNYYLLTFYKDKLSAICGVATGKIDPSSDMMISYIFSELSSRLTKKYGNPNEFIYTIKEDSKHKDSFVLSLMSKDRVQKKIWNKDLPDNISSIELETTADFRNYYVKLYYRYDNYNEVLESIKDSGDSL